MHGMAFRLYVIAATVSVIALSCSKTQLPPDVSTALDKAGENQAELQRVIDHYLESGDSLKLQAAYYLIGNMEGHGYVTFKFVDTSGHTVTIDVASFASYDSLLHWLDAVEAERGELDYEREATVEDLETISADYLIENIDLAFVAWQSKPWAKNLSFEDFCRYVLPYRGSNEPLESWRQYFLDKYAGWEDSLQVRSSAMQAATVINNDVRKWFGFDERWYLHPTDQGFAEMLATGLGRCEDMTNMSIYAMRANGLAVTSDYTPYWANSGNNHAWNAIVNDDGRVVPFMGAEANPGEYELANQAAKVYRKTFHMVRDNLAFQPNRQEAVPRWLAGKNYLDVTADYYDVSDVTVKIDSTVPDSVDVAYICVFNDGDFKPIHWGRVEGIYATFTDMNTDLLYLPAFYLNEEIVPCGEPFAVTSDSTDTRGEAAKVYFRPDTDKLIDVSVTEIPWRVMAASTESLEPRPLEKGQSYELRYWDNGWQTLATKACTSSKLTFTKVPSGALLWLVKVNGKEDERAFTVRQGGELVFW